MNEAVTHQVWILMPAAKERNASCSVPLSIYSEALTAYLCIRGAWFSQSIDVSFQCFDV